MSLATCNAKLIARRDPLDGALDATLVAIVKQQSQGVFQIQEVFLGDMVKGQYILLPNFKPVVQDLSALDIGTDRVEPITRNTQILLFLKTVGISSEARPIGARFGDWAVAGFGNCYFWEGDPSLRESLRSMAARALSLRRSWEAANNITNERQRAEALWPFLWGYNGSCYTRTEAEFEKIGPVAGDYIAEQLPGMGYRQKDIFLTTFGVYHSPRLHKALVDELKVQEDAWEALVRRRGKPATFEEVLSADRIRYTGQPDNEEVRKASDIYGVLYQGFTGLGSFGDSEDLPFIRESALWSVKYRFKQVDDAALEIFRKMLDKANLPVIEAIWSEFSRRSFVGNELSPYEVMRALEAHRWPEAIPLMAQFVNVGFGQDLARRFLAQMTGVDFRGDANMWLSWYESHRAQLNQN